MNAFKWVPGPNLVPTFVLFFAIAIAPLPSGSRDPAAVVTWCIVLGTGLVFLSTRQLRSGHVALLAGVGFVAACYAFVLHEQLSSHPWIAPFDPVWAQAAALLGHPVPPSASVVRGEPLYALWPTLANLLALTLGLVVGVDKRRAEQALLVMGWTGGAYAVYGMLTVIFGPIASIGNEARVYMGDALTATFVNRNTAAPYLGSVSVVWLVLTMATIRRAIRSGKVVWSLAPSQVIEDFRSRVELMVRAALFLVCVSAVFMTYSRGGALATLAGFVIVFVLFLRRDLPGGRGVVLLGAGAVEIALMTLLVIGTGVGDRIDAQGLSDTGRLSAYKSTLRIIADHPWFGTGLGTFAAIFPGYRRDDISIVGIWDKAHSTPLELAAELGIPLTLVIVLGWIVVLLVLLQGTRRSRRETIVPLAAMGVCLVALLHTSIDFSLQVSGYAIVVFAIAGVGLAQTFPGEPDLEEGRRPRSRGRRIAKIDAELDEMDERALRG